MTRRSLVFCRSETWPCNLALACWWNPQQPALSRNRCQFAETRIDDLDLTVRWCPCRLHRCSWTPSSPDPSKARSQDLQHLIILLNQASSLLVLFFSPITRILQSFVRNSRLFGDASKFSVSNGPLRSRILRKWPHFLFVWSPSDILIYYLKISTGWVRLKILKASLEIFGCVQKSQI